jgi:hypothetical protein
LSAGFNLIGFHNLIIHNLEDQVPVFMPQFYSSQTTGSFSVASTTRRLRCGIVTPFRKGTVIEKADHFMTPGMMM